MSATTEQAIARLDTAEYDLVAGLAALPASQEALRGRALEVLEQLRAQKRALLARSPFLVPGSNPASWIDITGAAV